ncbi:MAG TPA: hypothetical protein VN922_17035, partial [Bacteroidia bacterium]|nr:hypothetical protein [Bacteroidia bacterium]
MIFKINSKSLLSALNLTAKGINASTVSDTSNYHFKKTDAGLEISTCNLEISMQTCIDVATTDPIDILIPGEKLVRLLSSLPDQFVTFTIGDDNSISIKAISGAYELSGYSAENFPIIKTETNLDVTVPAEDLTEAIYATAFARSVEPTMQVFTG